MVKPGDRRVQGSAPTDPYRINEAQLSSVEGTDRGRVLLVANHVVPESYVDYGKVYYYNASKPLLGSSQATIKLASDGTMTEGSAQQESKTLQAFLDLLPIKDVLSGLAKGAVPIAAIEGKDKNGIAKYELSSDVKILKHTHFLIQAGQYPPCSPPTNEITSCPFNLTKEDASEAKKDSPKENEVGISGSIKLPRNLRQNRADRLSEKSKN